MKEEYKGKMKILIAFGVLFLVVAILLALIFLDSKKTYTVQFDLNGGTLLGGSLEQRVLHGHDAVPPNVTKEGAYYRPQIRLLGDRRNDIRPPSRQKRK